MLIGLALISAWLGAVFIVASLISKRWPQQQELSRKVVHIGAGFALPIAWATEIPDCLHFFGPSRQTLYVLPF